MKIMVVGDVHGEWGKLNDIINSHKPNMILQCGDWGFWPRYHGRSILHNNRPRIYENYGVKNPNTDIYWCDGNHEDHWSLAQLETNEIQPRVFYMKRGSTLELPDGRRVLFMGGANSIDKKQRTLGDDWFPDEVITQRQVMELPDVKIDIVISHTCPEEFLPKLEINGFDDNDPSRKALSYILDRYHPSMWFFGHWHRFKQGYTARCKWTALNMASCTGWWRWLVK